MASRIIITEWAFDSYLELSGTNAFSSDEYWEVIRPDVERLQKYPKDSKFENSKFWSIATLNGERLSHGFKMKWHNIGAGAVQLRLCVALLDDSAFLC